MAVAVYLKSGGIVKVIQAVSVDRGGFVTTGDSPPDSLISVELKDQKSKVVASFLRSEVAGYVIEPEGDAAVTPSVSESRHRLGAS